MEEVDHIISLLETTKEGINNKDSIKLNEISNQTIHSASTIQDAGNITIAVLIYTISKLVERKDYIKIKNWDKFIKKLNLWLDLAIDALKNKKTEKYEYYLEQARKSLTTASINLKPYIKEVLRKASINKASKIYEHGISMGQTAKLLGITQWELSEYTGQKQNLDVAFGEVLNVKKRAQMAMEFFS